MRRNAGAMRLIVNENIPGVVCRALRDRGHDVFVVKESMAGADDATILAVAQSESRLVLTFQNVLVGAKSCTMLGSPGGGGMR